jgi:hypothetical protein
MFYDRTSPWLLKIAVLICMFLSRHPGSLSWHNLCLVTASASLTQLCLICPSIVLAVRKRRVTTDFIMESITFHALTLLTGYAARYNKISHTETVICFVMSLSHSLFTLFASLKDNSNLLVGGNVLAWCCLWASWLAPAGILLYTPGNLPMTSNMLLYIFSGEITGLTSSVLTYMLRCVCDSYEACMASW